MIAQLGRKRIGFDDFRCNGLLLPAREKASRRLRLPLHRGPHRVYNEMVIERLGQIEQGWSAERERSSHTADADALMRISLLQGALKRRLLDQRQPLRLNKRDPLGSGRDFALLDAMAEQLWQSTQERQEMYSDFAASSALAA